MHDPIRLHYNPIGACSGPSDQEKRGDEAMTDRRGTPTSRVAGIAASKPVGPLMA